MAIIYSKLGSVLAFEKFETLIAMPRLPLQILKSQLYSQIL